MRFLSILLTLFFLISCTPNESITINTNPMGAKVYLNGELQDSLTPLNIKFSLDRDHLITIILDGYEQRDIEVKRIFKKDKQTNNTISAALSGASSGNPILAANNVIRATGTGNPDNYTFGKNTLTVKLDKISQ
tara:strand:- start:4834 stop:5235 length:402 start_codon:yes stop_codon:yes gene_type:complete